MTTGQWWALYIAAWCIIPGCLWIGLLRLIRFFTHRNYRRIEQARYEAWLRHVSTLPVPVVDWVAWESEISR